MIEVVEVPYARWDGRNRDGGESSDFGRLLLLDAELIERSRRIFPVVGLVEPVSPGFASIDLDGDGSEVGGSLLLRREGVGVLFGRRLTQFEPNRRGCQLQKEVMEAKRRKRESERDAKVLTIVLN